MIKPLCPKILLVLTFLSLAFALSSVFLYAEAVDTPSDSSNSSISDVAQTDTTDLHQSDTTGLMAQAEAQAQGQEHYCVRHCRHHYEERLAECNEPGHEHHHHCEEWAKERERECLEHCYQEHRE